jgi:hypothetical protein
MGKRRIKPNFRRRVLRLPDLDHCKLAVLNSLGSPASRRVYEYAIDQFVAWYCPQVPICESHSQTADTHADSQRSAHRARTKKIDRHGHKNPEYREDLEERQTEDDELCNPNSRTQIARSRVAGSVF